MSKKILIVEDDESIIELLEMYLKDEGYLTKSVIDGSEAVGAFEKFNPDLILLDLMLPGEGGLEICKTIRQKSNVPVIMLTAKESEVDKVLGLELGADDYMTKPFSPRELVARVKAVLRRANPQEKTEKITYENLRIDLDKREAFLGDEEVIFTAKEFDLLVNLAQRPGIVFSREKLLEQVWEYGFYGDLRTVDVHIRHLREKLKDDSEKPGFIETVWGVGYRFRRKKDV